MSTLTREEFRDFESRNMKERGKAGLQDRVRRLCLEHRKIDPLTLFYHTFDSRKSAAGYPDCSIVLPTQGRLIYAELKTYAARPTVAQRQWLDRLSCLMASVVLSEDQTGVYRFPLVECYLWRPQHFFHDVIRLVLLGNPEATTYPLGQWVPYEGVPGDPYSEPKG